jgi:hypothetical protein
MNIFVHRNGQQLGPFSETDIRTQLASGAISSADLVWWDGQPGWVPLSQSPYAAVSVPPAAADALPPPPPVSVPPITGGPGTASPSTSPKTSQLAIWALVCGVAEFLCGFTFIPAIILGHLGLSETKKNPALQGRGMAWVGLILGYLYILVLVAIFVLITLGNQVQSVFSTISSQLQTTQDATNTPADNSTPATNTPDTNSPATNAAPANQ